MMRVESVPERTRVETTTVDGKGRVSLDAFLHLWQGDDLVVGVGHGIVELDALRDPLASLEVVRVMEGPRFPEVDDLAGLLHDLDTFLEILVGSPRGDHFLLGMAHGVADAEVGDRDDDAGQNEPSELALEHGSSLERK